jgi:acetyl esterase/lipase
MCQDISKQHITCLSANYTLGGGDGPEQEAKEAVLWARRHAEQLHIRPNRIFVGGGSVGGYLALSTALVDPRPQSMPNGLVLFNPILSFFPPGPTGTLKDDVVGPLPPMVIFHGTADRLSPYPDARAFVAAVKSEGTAADLQTFRGRQHGFFNYAEGNNPDYFTVTKGVVDFVNAHE